MKVQITDTFRISSDPTNVIVEEKKIAGDESKNPGEVRWIGISYHATIEQAVNWILRREIRLIDADDVHELIDEIKFLKLEVMKHLNEIKNI